MRARRSGSASINRVVPAERLVAEVDALADRLARVPPDVMAPTKLMLNRAMDAAGFAAAVEMGLDLQSFINMWETSRAFDEIVRRDGLKAALAWRDAALRRAAARRRKRPDAPPDARCHAGPGRCSGAPRDRDRDRTALPPLRTEPDGTKVPACRGPLVLYRSTSFEPVYPVERRHPFGHRESLRPRRTPVHSELGFSAYAEPATTKGMPEMDQLVIERQVERRRKRRRGIVALLAALSALTIGAGSVSLALFTDHGQLDLVVHDRDDRHRVEPGGHDRESPR